MQLKYLIRFSLVLSAAVIMLGAYTRLSDAGLGCPDWPGCYGHFSVPNESHEIDKATQLFPQHTIEADKAWLEMLHRYLAGSLGGGIVAIWVLSLKKTSSDRRFASLLVLLVVAQAALGMWTVTLKLMPVVVMLHLIGGFSLFALLWLLTLQNSHLPQQLSHEKVPSVHYYRWCWLVGIASFALVLQILLGGWTSSNYAALMCTSLPVCQGQWWQQLDFLGAFNLIQYGFSHADGYEFGVLGYAARLTIHVSHRLWAMVAAGLLLSLALVVIRCSDLTELRWAGISLAVLMMLQVGLGVTNVYYQLPIVTAVGHNFVAALLLLNMVFIYFVLTVTGRVSVQQPLNRSATIGHSSSPTHFNTKG